MFRRTEPDNPDRQPARPWHALTASEVLAELDSDPANGLGSAEASARRS